MVDSNRAVKDNVEPIFSFGSVDDLVRAAETAVLESPHHPDVRKLIVYVGEHWMNSGLVRMLKSKGYEQFDITGFHYSDVSTRAFVRERRGKPADFIFENPHNMMNMQLGEFGVDPLYYLNHMKIENQDIDRYLHSLKHVIKGEKRSIRDAVLTYVPPIALLGACTGFAAADRMDAAVIAGSLGIASMFVKNLYDIGIHHIASQNFNHPGLGSERFMGIPALVVALDGRLPDARKYH